MSRRTLVTWMIAAGLITGVTPAVAGKGGSGAGSLPPSITIATVDGTSMAAATVKPTPKLGDRLTFATTVPALAGWEYPTVVVSCYQDVNGDGTVDTNMLGPDLVYSWTRTSRAATFTARWRTRRSGPSAAAAPPPAAPSSTPTAGRAVRNPIRVLASTGDWLAQG